MSGKSWVVAYTAILLLLLIGFGCSGGTPTEPLVPDNLAIEIPEARTSDNASREVLGLWTMVYNVSEHTLTPISQRSASLHLNVREILEFPGALIDLQINNLDDSTMPIVNVDIGLHHPFGGLSEFAGFDVRGIFISRGNWTGWADPSLRVPKANEPRLANRDGYTRWWNPTEFTNYAEPWFSYSDGLLGAPHGWANFNSIINGYKMFADGLDMNGSLDTLDTTMRGYFQDGSLNWRHYTIDFGKIMSNWVIFNYAVDANWDFPVSGAPPFTVNDFSPSANAQEAYWIKVNETNNTLFYDGYSGTGALSLDIDVYDWQNPGEVTAVMVEAPELWGGPNYAIVVPGSGSGTYSTYHIDVAGCTPTHAGTTDVLVSVPCYDQDYQIFITNWPGTFQYGAYQLSKVGIGGSNCPPYVKAFNPGWQADEPVAPNSTTNRNCIWSDGTNVYVTWIDSRFGNPDTFFNKSSDGGQTWMPLDIRLSDDFAPNRIQRYPQIAASPDGQRVCVVWDDQRYSEIGPNQDIDEPMYSISSDAGASWSANYSAKMSGIPNLQQFQPAICADDQGAFYIAWIDEDIGALGDKATVFGKIPTGSDLVTVNTVVSDQVGLNWFGAQDWKMDIAYDNNTDTIYVIWSDTRNDFSGTNTAVDVFIDKSSDGGSTFGIDVKVNTDNTNSDQTHPCLTIGDSGVIYVSYVDEQTGTPLVAFVKSLSGGASFSNYQTIDSLPGVHWYPDIARGGLENIFIVWQMDYTCYLTWSCDEGDTWEAPQMIDPVETPDEVTSPTVWVGDDQRVFVAGRYRAFSAEPSHVRVWRWQ